MVDLRRSAQGGLEAKQHRKAGDKWSETVTKRLLKGPPNWSKLTEEMKQITLECRQESRRTKNPQLMDLLEPRKANEFFQRRRELTKTISE